MALANTLPPFAISLSEMTFPCVLSSIGPSVSTPTRFTPPPPISSILLPWVPDPFRTAFAQFDPVETNVRMCSPQCCNAARSSIDITPGTFSAPCS